MARAKQMIKLDQLILYFYKLALQEWKMHNVYTIVHLQYELYAIILCTMCNTCSWMIISNHTA